MMSKIVTVNYDVTGINAWQIVYTCHAPPNFQWQFEILSTETSDFLKQIVFLNPFNSVF